MPKYTIRQNRIKSGCVAGFTVEDDTRLVFDRDSMYHGFFLRGLDGADSGASWGRLSFNAEASENIMYYVYVYATDNKIIMIGGLVVRKRLFERKHAVRRTT